MWAELPTLELGRYRGIVYYLLSILAGLLSETACIGSKQRGAPGTPTRLHEKCAAESQARCEHERNRKPRAAMPLYFLPTNNKTPKDFQYSGDVRGCAWRRTQGQKCCTGAEKYE
jgi:hypothetical protein